MWRAGGRETMGTAMQGNSCLTSSSNGYSLHSTFLFHSMLLSPNLHHSLTFYCCHNKPLQTYWLTFSKISCQQTACISGISRATWDCRIEASFFCWFWTEGYFQVLEPTGIHWIVASHNTVSSLHMNKFYSKSVFLSPICL